MISRVRCHTPSLQTPQHRHSSSSQDRPQVICCSAGQHSVSVWFDWRYLNVPDVFCVRSTEKHTPLLTPQTNTDPRRQEEQITWGLKTLLQPGLQRRTPRSGGGGGGGVCAAFVCSFVCCVFVCALLGRQCGLVSPLDSFMPLFTPFSPSLPRRHLFVAPQNVEVKKKSRRHFGCSYWPTSSICFRGKPDTDTQPSVARRQRRRLLEHHGRLHFIAWSAWIW